MASFSIRSTLAGAAALTTVTTGAFVVPAAAADARAEGSAFARCAAVAGDLAAHLADQASAQHRAAVVAQKRHDALVARAKRAAKEAAAKEAAAKAAKAKAARESGTAHASRSAAKGRGTLGGWMLPVAGSIGTPYHATSSLWSSGYHTGVDFQASVGTPVHAAGAGTVVEAGWGGSYGNNVVIRHADGMYTQYAHLSSLGVSVGQTVSAGQQIGLSGATGNVTGPHLHFEARTAPSYGADVDPLAYLRSKGVRI
ncbi:M23 family metallopeptidase [Streptomyces sp. PA03-1a]|nr:M23 family metallopeptidase [Streptomyces sp. PA03-1a]MDX2811401.1 M23 family metallopeptidase [Streptomyces sp. PA03-5A]